jgi:hypothetical protein
MSFPDVWWTLYATFIFLCIVGAALFCLWLVAVIVSAAITRRTKINPARYRVGGSL